MTTAKEKEAKILKEYACGYCKYVWQQKVRRVGGHTDAVGRTLHAFSSQVQCPRCKNGCKTWEEGKIV
jgi:hypothetical protein